MKSLSRDALRLLLRDGELGEGWRLKGRAAGGSPSALRGLVESFAGVADPRRTQGRRHGAASLLAVLLLSKLAGNDGPAPPRSARRGWASASSGRSRGAW